jgi:hypothetical protein
MSNFPNPFQGLIQNPPIQNLLEGQQQFQNPPVHNPFVQFQGGGSSSQQESEFLPDDNIFQYKPLPEQFSKNVNPNDLNIILDHMNDWIIDMCIKINALYQDDGRIRKRVRDLTIKEIVEN